jgi:HSP20 family molecular chaperone IbpA
MANQSGAAKAKDIATPVAVNQVNDQLKQKLDSEISRRAFELYESGGARDSDDLSHWYQAESDVMLDVPEIHESASWYTVNVPLPGAERDDIYVSVDRGRAIIAAEKRSDEGVSQPDGAASSRRSLFLVARWNSEVDPSTASAYLKNGNLTLTVKQAKPV